MAHHRQIFLWLAPPNKQRGYRLSVRLRSCLGIFCHAPAHFLAGCYRPV